MFKGYKAGLLLFYDFYPKFAFDASSGVRFPLLIVIAESVANTGLVLNFTSTLPFYFLMCLNISSALLSESL
jgi:hypothetical protein